ncbi:MAG TPA: hypothetical protein VLB73_02070 [Patescibacteria group bacterium]|nr:hypothetical protein [Patescibacteria group bacterium]
MFGKFTYLSYTVLISVPLILVTWVYYWKILKKYARLIIFLVLLLTFYGSIMMTVGLAVRAWSYNPDKFLPIFIFGAAIDDIIWWACIFLLEVSTVVVLLKKFDKKEKLLKRD